MATTLRVSESTRVRAAALAAQAGSSIGDVVALALDAYEKAEFWRRTREALAADAAHVDDVDPAWARTLRDGLDGD